eukprot:5560492-Alexandrium_andersonii.AAC.1
MAQAITGRAVVDPVLQLLVARAMAVRRHWYKFAGGRATMQAVHQRCVQVAGGASSRAMRWGRSACSMPLVLSSGCGLIKIGASEPLESCPLTSCTALGRS